MSFLTTAGRAPSSLIPMWEGVVLTEEEEKVTDALRILEPLVERIAFVGGQPGYPTPAGAFLKLKGSDQRIPWAAWEME